MPRNSDVLKSVAGLLLAHATVGQRRSIRAGDIGVSRQPNAPRTITILAAVALTVVGVAVSLHPIQPVLDLLANANLELTREQGWLCLVVSPAALVVGSFFRGI